MHGKVLSYDGASGAGFIIGRSGVRYSFTKADLRRLAPLDEGTAVEFHPDEGRAREIFVVREKPAAVAPARFGRFAEADAAPSLGVWSHFFACLTDGYAVFRGRARRKEYWSFALIWMLAILIATVAGVAVDAALGNLDDTPVATIGLPALLFLATIVPAIAVTIRRLHDIGLSGWFYLVVFVPSVGGLIILVMTLMPSQKHDNRWGPAPEGIIV